MRFAGAVSILALGAGTTAFAQDASNAADKDQVIKDLQDKLGAMEARVSTLEGAQTGNLGSQVDGTVHQAPATPVADPRRLNISAPGLEGLDISGGVHVRGDYWGNFNEGGGSNDVLSFGTEAWLNFHARVSEKTIIGITLHYADVWGNDTSGADRLTDGSSSPGLTTLDSNPVSVSEAFLGLRDLYQTGIDMTAGRQRIVFGEERMMGDDEWLLNRTSFDGFRFDQDMGEGVGMWHLIAVRLNDSDSSTDSELSPSDGNKVDNADLYGFYYQMLNPDAGAIDLYLFHLEDMNYPGGMERTRLTTYGARWASPNWSGFTADVEAATQFGEIFGDKTHNYGFGTWAGHFGGAYKMTDVEYLDGFHANYDYASGGSGASDNFQQLFPSLHGWFGLMDLFSWSNIQHWNVGTDIKCCEGSLAVGYHWNRLASSNGGFFGYNASAGPSTAGGSKSLGQEVDAVYSVDCGKTTKVSMGLGYFFPGNGYHDMTGANNNMVYSYLAFRTSF